MPDFSYELSAREQGSDLVIGVDEAGRGPLAGPVAAAAVSLPEGYAHALLDDSKKLSEKKRLQVFKELMAEEHVIWGLSYAEPDEIDQVNILRATHAAMARAVADLLSKRRAGKEALSVYCLIDGLAVPKFPYPSEGIVKGDGKSLSIAAASIVAKVSRDAKMLEYAEMFPQYGFERHKGYGTKAHLAALKEYGPTPIHRQSFAPVAQLSLPFD